MAQSEITIRITGEAGQGMKTIGTALCQISKKAGLHIFANLDYMSRIRGGNNFFQLRVSTEPVFAIRERCNIIVSLDRLGVEIHGSDRSLFDVLFCDAKKFKLELTDKKFVDVPLYGFAQEYGGSDILVSAVACGLVVAMMQLQFKHVEEVLRSTFAGKTEEIIEKNVRAAKAGYEFAQQHCKDQQFAFEESAARKELFLNGNEAIGLGAIQAGCKFYSAYPMTPSTSIMNFMAEHADEYAILVEQAEDEIAAINMVVGASFAGVRAMTATSGGGFALMSEGISLAAMTETPVVVVDAQRPAPATGFPTRTEQGDLDFVLYAGHGEFARTVFAPGTIEECFTLSRRAFDIAERYQIPVIILTDQYLADSYCNVAGLPHENYKNKRLILSKEKSSGIQNYQRYALTASGVSPRAIPSWIQDVIYVDSDEHTPEGHITEDGEIRVKMTQKRFSKKMKALRKEIQKPTTKNLASAKTVLVCFGSNYGVVQEAVSILNNKEYGFVHLSQVWPFPADFFKKKLKDKKIITIENNAGGQLAKLIQQETCFPVSDSIVRYDGRPFTVDGILKEIKRRRNR